METKKKIKTCGQIFLLLGGLFVFQIAAAQRDDLRRFRVMCYNVENFFDCVDDSLTNDSEFLPNGIRGWSFTRYKAKQAAIGRVIACVGEWEPPALVGLCEVESEKCLVDLTRFSGLKNLKYKFLHHESPDPRGVDVALLYQPRKFKLLTDRAIPIRYADAPSARTRDILYAKGIVPTGDTLHVFVCHFPSRLGGELESEDKRMYVASVLRSKVDSLFACSSASRILIMGDFNDFPIDKSIFEVLKAKAVDVPIEPHYLYNLAYHLHVQGKGSNKHNGEWGALDQMIVSGALLNDKRAFFTSEKDFRFFEADFLFEPDNVNFGKQPFRTFNGFKYQGGYSDHLPVVTDFWY